MKVIGLGNEWRTTTGRVWRSRAGSAATDCRASRSGSSRRSSRGRGRARRRRLLRRSAGHGAPLRAVNARRSRRALRDGVHARARPGRCARARPLPRPPAGPSPRVRDRGQPVRLRQRAHPRCRRAVAWRSSGVHETHLTNDLVRRLEELAADEGATASPGSVSGWARSPTSTRPLPRALRGCGSRHGRRGRRRRGRARARPDRAGAQGVLLESVELDIERRNHEHDSEGL